VLRVRGTLVEFNDAGVDGLEKVLAQARHEIAAGEFHQIPLNVLRLNLDFHRGKRGVGALLHSQPRFFFERLDEEFVDRFPVRSAVRHEIQWRPLCQRSLPSRDQRRGGDSPDELSARQRPAHRVVRRIAFRHPLPI
jgi:hypothetical protein